MLYTVLISQHEELSQELMVFLPKACSYTSVTSSAGLKALLEDSNAFGPGKYLILVDLRRPVSNWNILSEIKPFLTEQEHKILALISSSEERSLAFQSGADDYLLFPLLPNEIQSRIQGYTLSLEAIPGLESSNIFECERLAIIGRLASTIAHEIGNSMQAIRGALALAVESPDDFQDVLEYVQLSYRESERVVKFIAMLRDVYQPQTEVVAPISLDRFLDRLIILTKHETEKQGIELSLRPPPQLVALKGLANQLFLAFLSILLNTIDIIGNLSGGRLEIAVKEWDAMVSISFSAHTPLGRHDSIAKNKGFANTQFMTDNFMATFFVARTIILAHDGMLAFSLHDDGFELKVSIPAWQTSA